MLYSFFVKYTKKVIHFFNLQVIIRDIGHVIFENLQRGVEQKRLETTVLRYVLHTYSPPPQYAMDCLLLTLLTVVIPLLNMKTLLSSSLNFSFSLTIYEYRLTISICCLLLTILVSNIDHFLYRCYQLICLQVCVKTASYRSQKYNKRAVSLLYI